MLEKFPDQCQCFLGIIASEIIDLLNNVVVGFGQKLLLEDITIKAVCLSEMSYDKINDTESLEVFPPFF